MSRSIKRIKPFMEMLIRMWEHNPDQRFGQFLINNGFISDDLRTWNAEMSDYKIAHKDIREIQTWSTINNETNKREDTYIKDIKTNHLENIIKTQNNISDNLRNILIEELKRRVKDE